LAAQDLIAALQNKHKLAPFDLTPKHTAALRQLANIFQEAAGIKKDGNKYPQPRVQTSTSSNHTSPRVIATKPQVHQQLTRNNQPMPTITEEAPVTTFQIPAPQPHRSGANYQQQTNGRHQQQNQFQITSLKMRNSTMQTLYSNTQHGACSMHPNDSVLLVLANKHCNAS